jgi:PRC-barrel domain
MARATAHPDHQCISSEDIQGTTVYGADGSNIGEIDHLIVDKLSGRVAYAVMSFGGFMGLGHSHYPIPWGALTYDQSLGGFRTNITEQQLKDAPEFSDDSWQDRDWEVRTHRHYGMPRRVSGTLMVECIGTSLAYRDCLTEPGSVRIESARSGSWAGSAAAECAKSSMLMRASAVAKVRSACSTAGITTLLSSAD